MQNILGHASLVTTVKYTRMTGKTHNRARTHINAIMQGFNITWGQVQ